MEPKTSRGPRFNGVAASAVAIIAACVLGNVSASANVSQTPVVMPCPTGDELVSVETMEATGPYIGPRFVDDAGNNNGYVCGHVLPEGRREADCKSGGLVACELPLLGLPIDVFTDDDNPAQLHAQTGG